MPSAELPATRTIKPKLELLDRISLKREQGSRTEAAEELWQYATEHYLKDVLAIVPVQGENWEFPDEDRFIFRQQSATPVSDRSDWIKSIGIEPGSVALTAEVTSADWTTLVRERAVKLQKPFDSSAFGHDNTLHPKCKAHWDGTTWTIQFDEIPWLELTYEEVPIATRPEFSAIQDVVTFAMGEADKSLSNKQKIASGFRVQTRPWQDCIPSLSEFHDMVLAPTSEFSDSFCRAWNCVWPTVYREQNVLRGKADLANIRVDLKASLEATPKLTVWMFVLAKLVSVTQSGMGLGICADFGI